MTSYPDTDSLYGEAINVGPIDRDWMRDYGGTWDFIAAPDCTECSEPCRHVSGVELADEFDTPAPAGWENETWTDWRCVNRDCENVGQQVDPLEQELGPMMSYSYHLPSDMDRTYDESDAEKIARLPLCIVRFYEPDDPRPTGYALALSGGGMDLSWEICEAFMRLGFLPPAHFCELPAISGKPSGDRDAWVLAGCLRTVEIVIHRAERMREHLANLR